MTNQSATFDQVPRSLMNPTDGEQALYDHDAVKTCNGPATTSRAPTRCSTRPGLWIAMATVGAVQRQKLSYIATCPNGWSDWQAAIEVVAAAGKKIGIDLTSNNPNGLCIRLSSPVRRPAARRLRHLHDVDAPALAPPSPGAYPQLISSEWVGMASNWSGNWGQYSNPDADALIQAIPGETDPPAEGNVHRTGQDLPDRYPLLHVDVPPAVVPYRERDGVDELPAPG
jgi:peptide/nickel transport system substrate-binding protein